MKKIAVILALLLPMLAIGQGTTTIRMKRAFIDTLYITKAVTDTSTLLLVMDEDGKIKVNRISTGTDYWTVATSLLQKIDTTTGLNIYTGAGADYSYIAQTANGQQVRATTIKRSTGAGASVLLNDNPGYVNISGTDGTYTDQIQVNQGLGYLTGLSSKNTSNRMHLGSSSVPWGTLYADSAKYTKDITINSMTVGRGKSDGGPAGNNSAFGRFSLYSNTTGTGNSAFGMNSLRYVTTGTSNTAVGYGALNLVVTGIENTAMGSGAGSNVTGSGNAAFGMNSGQKSTGNNNSSFGPYSLINNTSGYSNTAVGVYALKSNTTGSNNIAIGDSAGYSYTTLSNRMYLGARDTTTTGIFWNRTTGINKGWWLGSMNIKDIAVGSRTAEKMLVHDTLTGDVRRLPIPANSQWTTSGSNIYYTGGNVGIGTTAPKGLSHIRTLAGGTYVKTVILDAGDNTTSSAIGIDFNTSSNDLGNDPGARIRGIRRGSNAITDLIFSTRNSASSLVDHIALTNAGLVGIGTTAPATTLDVNGTATLPTILGGSAVGSNITYTSTSGAGTAGGIAHQFKGGTNGGTIIATMLNNGSLGIGTTAPGYSLQIAGTGYASQVLGSGTSLQSAKLTTWNSADNLTLESRTNKDIVFNTSGSNERMRLTSAGNVGIGTTNPLNKLHIGNATTGGIRVAGATDDSIGISSTSSLRMYGNATVFDDLMMPFSTGTTAGTGYPQYNTDSLWHHFVIDTTGPTKCIIYMPVQLPHKWKEGSTIYPHIHYRHATAQGTPTFKIKYKWINIGATSGAWNWHTMSTTTGTTDLTHQMVYNAAGISGAGKTISSMLLCQIYLTGQTGTGGIDAYQFDIHIECDALGSNSETSKN